MPIENPATAAASQEFHAWEAGGATSAEALTTWVGARMNAHEAALAALLAVEGPRTPENSLRLFDAAIEQLSLAGEQAGLLNSVAASMAVRDQAQIETQRVAQAASALSLNRQVYEALVAIDLEGASPATKHYVERTLLGYRLAGVERTRPRAPVCNRSTNKPRASRSNSAATFRRAPKPLKPPWMSWTACPPTIFSTTRLTPAAASPSQLTSPTCSQ